jgi:hypothetical protein
MAGRQKKSWRDLTPTQQRAIVVGGAAELVLTMIAVRDLRRRPRAGVRGPKLVWLLSFVVQPFGPLLYLKAGRRD